MNLTPAMMTALQSGVAHPRWLIHMTMKNRLNGQVESSGLWSGLFDITMNIDGQARTYKGAGGLLNVGTISSRIGLDIGSHDLSLSMHEKEVVDVIRTYDPSFGKCDIHLMLVDDAESQIGMTRVFRGTVDGIDIQESQTECVASVKLVSSMRLATKPLYLKQSDAFQKTRNQEDKGREYTNLTGQKVWWGNKAHDFRWNGPSRSMTENAKL